jgi:D-alanyl-D-alanine carboxypeptidase
VKLSSRFFAHISAVALLLVSGCAALAARSFAIVDSQSGYILAEQDGKAKRQVGSLTKIATAMVVLDWADAKHGDLNRVVTIPPEAFVGTGENNIGFQPGDTMTLRDLLYAALVQSDNVAAYTLAFHVGTALPEALGVAPSGKAGPVGLFVAQMNALAKQLNMQHTRFLNPHGIDANETPYSSALDMARLTRYAMNKAAFRFYVSQRERQISFIGGGKKRGYLLRNTNELLGTNGIDGVKTGRTARAGDCLILSSHRESEIRKEGNMTYVTPRHLIVVVLGSTDRFGEGAGLLARGWQLYDQWAAAGRLVQPSKTL